MRRKDREITDLNEIYRTIDKCQFCRIGFCDNEQPYIVPVCFGIKKGVLFFHSANEGMKLDILRKNPNVCFQMDCETEIIISENPCKCSLKYRSVIGNGTAEILTNVSDKKDALSLIMKKYSGSENKIEFSDQSVQNTYVVQISIKSLYGKKSIKD
jgi:uncharacterized protein